MIKIWYSGITSSLHTIKSGIHVKRSILHKRENTLDFKIQEISCLVCEEDCGGF